MRTKLQEHCTYVAKWTGVRAIYEKKERHVTLTEVCRRRDRDRYFWSCRVVFLKGAGMEPFMPIFWQGSRVEPYARKGLSTFY